MTAACPASPLLEARDPSLRLAEALWRERTELAKFLVSLAEFDRDRRWLRLGHPSLFWFLTRELGLSHASAYHRKVAAELIQRFPEVVGPLQDGRLCVTRVIELARVMTEDNRAEVLARFLGEHRRAA